MNTVIYFCGQEACDEYCYLLLWAGGHVMNTVIYFCGQEGM